MACCHHYFATTPGGEEAFSVDVSSITYGAGCLAEAGEQNEDVYTEPEHGELPKSRSSASPPGTVDANQLSLIVR